ncbi:MAG: UDP-3-O-(3-hydroxymyristoyl)glucosamine N-acyltransferase [Phycisphaerae bacterium]|nr:UDP-3-O-(3-hydroxymyristoyl)glucosamine N-acyltransferase [Phycisphaerae bacterium]
MTITTGALASLLGAELIGSPDIPLARIDAADKAGRDTLTFIRTSGFAAAWRNGQAAAAIVANKVPTTALFDNGAPPPDRAVLRVADADVALIQALEFFADKPAPVRPGVHPSAAIDPDARIDPDASVGPHCTIMSGALVGPGAQLIANVVIGRGASIGDGTVLHPGVVVLDRCVIGRGCILHAGVVIGADGFGYHPRPDGRGLLKVPHIGNVTIGDDVEIGANTCIDRAKFGSTSVGNGTKIDNLVQIGHNCRIGRCCILCGEVGLAGSVIIGDGAMLGGRTGVADNIEIGAGAKIAAYSGVINDVPAGVSFVGSPAGPADEWRRIYAHLRRLGRNRGHEGRGG